jgi:hypothetical protein
MSGRVMKRMSGPAQVSNAAATKYTVAAGRRGIVRHIHIQNPSNAAVTFTMSIGADAAGTRLFDGAQFSLAAGQVFDHFGVYVLEAAELIQALAGTNNILVLTIDGEEEVLS